ncbi:MAG: hypothetical protein C0402_01505 [Thermodesulfovibrio sp.]|nr:hypothetical protein [Thermodesulfovibrio sp.]
MKDDGSINTDQSEIEQKCSPCYCKDGCMLYSSKSVTGCLGPFAGYDDWKKKVHADWEAEEAANKKAREKGLRKFHSDRALELYLHNKLLTEIAMEGDNEKGE